MVGSIMAKGQRKRSNKKKSSSKKVKASKPKACSCGKFNCNGSCKNEEVPNALDELAVKVYKQTEVNILKQSVDLSNRVAKLLNEKQKKLNHLAASKRYVKKLREGKVNVPLLRKVSGNIFETITDLEELADRIEEENKDIADSVEILDGQISHWYDEYLDARIRAFLMEKQALEPILKERSIKNVQGHYHGVSGESKKAEEKSFIKQFDAENLSKEDKKELQQTMKKAVKANAVSRRKQGKKNS